jgi:uncharacterized protein GlcG (DUF336 family)
VQALVTASAKVFDTAYTIAVVDREGVILGVYTKAGAAPTSIANYLEPEPTEDVAAALARTGAFFSNNQAPLSSRTVRFISGIHFPPGILNTPNAALYGIENTNRGCRLALPGDYFPGKELAFSARVNGSTPGLGILTGKATLSEVTTQYPIAVNPGGIPIYRGSTLVGGIGVAGLDSLGAVAGRAAEFAAIRGIQEASLPLAPVPIPIPPPGEVFIDGIRLPFVGETPDERAAILLGAPPLGTPERDPSVGLPAGMWVSGPVASPRDTAPEGWLVLPKDGVGAPSLSAAEVDQIITACVRQANLTRAAIRLPPGQPCKMAIAVGDRMGNVIGLFRMPDSTVFSVDVAVSKARNAFYFSSTLRNPAELPGLPMGTAVTARTLGFGSQPLFPPGIDLSGPGPFFQSLFIPDLNNSCTQGMQPSSAGFEQSGIVFFPGSAPLYLNGVLVGGLGVSGDGVEQDDFVTAAGTVGFEPPAAIRADQVSIDGVRMPYFKFPRNPTTGVFHDSTTPRVLAAKFFSGNATVLVEVVAGAGIDQALTLASLSVEVGSPLMPPPVGTTIDSPVTNVFRIIFPAPLASGTPVRVHIEPTDVFGQSPGAQIIDLAALKSTADPDFTQDGKINAEDLLSLMEAMRNGTKVNGHDLTGDNHLDASDEFEFSLRWHGAVGQ